MLVSPRKPDALTQAGKTYGFHSREDDQLESKLESVGLSSKTFGFHSRSDPGSIETPKCWLCQIKLKVFGGGDRGLVHVLLNGGARMYINME